VNGTFPGRDAARITRRSAALPRFVGWSSLGTRILLVNLVAILALAGALFYIEGFRSRLLETRGQELLRQGDIMAQFLENQGLDKGSAAILDISSPRGTRIRLYGADGMLLADNWTNPDVMRFQLVDPTTAGFRRESAILIDRAIDLLTGQGELAPYAEPAFDSADAWDEVGRAARSGRPVTAARQTPDRLVVLQAAVPLEGAEGPRAVVLLTLDTPDVIDLVPCLPGGPCLLACSQCLSCPHHRRAAQAAGFRRAQGPARPPARRGGPAAAASARRDRRAGARHCRHDGHAAAADRRDRGLRSRCRA
jgi:hypothetical protein